MQDSIADRLGGDGLAYEVAGLLVGLEMSGEVARRRVKLAILEVVSGLLAAYLRLAA